MPSHSPCDKNVKEIEDKYQMSLRALYLWTADPSQGRLQVAREQELLHQVLPLPLSRTTKRRAHQTRPHESSCQPDWEDRTASSL